MMQRCFKMTAMLVLVTGVTGCTVINEPPQGTCSVHDYKGRTWAAEGPRACRIALHRCERWHRRHLPNANWKCMHV